MYTLLNEKIYPASQITSGSPFFHAENLGQSVFETLRTYGPENPKIFHLEAHLDRLLRSASLLQIKHPTSLKNTLKEGVGALLEKTVKSSPSICDYRLKILYAPDFYQITIKPLEIFPEENYQKGVKITDAVFERNFPQAKYPSPAYHFFTQTQPADCFETIFFSTSGFLREGNITNVFAVFNGVLYTPEENILLGVTRDVVLKIARDLGIKIVVGEISQEKLLKADAIFLTNTTKEILPVKKWGEWQGQDFSLAQKLHQSFKNIIKNNYKKTKNILK
jgi:branched-chain amino acid aminotransferase